MSTERVNGRLIERVFDVGDSAEVQVNNVRGVVRITGTETAAVRLRIEVDPEHRLPDEDIERAPLELEHEGNRVKVKVLWDQAIMGWFERRSGPPPVHVVLDVPHRTQATVSVVSADASLADLSGPQSVNTVSGKIVVTDIEGDLRLNTVSGDALVTRSRGAVRWNSVSGDLMMREGKPAELAANSVSGSTELTLDGPLSGGLQAQTVSGSLRLTVPADFACDASLSSMSGSVRSALPVDVQESRRGRWHARINGGGPAVRLSSMSGSLEIITSGDGAIPAQVFHPGRIGGPFDPFRYDRGERGAAVGMPETDERRRILQQVERKEISIEAGLARLDALRQRAGETEGES